MQNSSLQHMTKFVPRIMLNWSKFLIMQGAMGELVSVEHLFSLHSPIIKHDVPQSVHQLLIQRCFVHLCVFFKFIIESIWIDLWKIESKFVCISNHVESNTKRYVLGIYNVGERYTRNFTRRCQNKYFRWCLIYIFFLLKNL